MPLVCGPRQCVHSSISYRVAGLAGDWSRTFHSFRQQDHEPLEPGKSVRYNNLLKSDAYQVDLCCPRNLSVKGGIAHRCNQMVRGRRCQFLLLPTAYAFRKGHCVRLALGGSDARNFLTDSPCTSRSSSTNVLRTRKLTFHTGESSSSA